MRRPAEPLRTRIIFAALAGLVRPVMNAFIGHRWEGFDKLPDGCIIVTNHMTEIDPFVVAHAIYSNGKYPRFLAKQSLLKLPVAGWLLKQTGQVPVDRGGAGAGASLEAATELLARGGVIGIYPEGTLTRDPDLWPMKGHTGAARLALKTGAPVVPVVHWGDQEFFPRYGKMIRPFPRKRATVKVGDPIDLSAFHGLPLTKKVLSEATEVIMSAITDEVKSLRGGTPPAQRWNPLAHGQSSTGRLKNQDPGSRRIQDHGTDGAV